MTQIVVDDFLSQRIVFSIRHRYFRFYLAKIDINSEKTKF
jgi:hypothetical protein